MADDGLETIIQVAFEFIPRYFGAFLKWIYLGFKTPYSELLEQNKSTKIGYVSLGIIILLTLLILNS